MNDVFTSIYFALNHVFLIQSDAEFVFIGGAIPSVSRSNAREFAHLGSNIVKIEKLSPVYRTGIISLLIRVRSYRQTDMSE